MYLGENIVAPLHAAVQPPCVAAAVSRSPPQRGAVVLLLHQSGLYLPRSFTPDRVSLANGVSGCPDEKAHVFVSDTCWD